MVRIKVTVPKLDRDEKRLSNVQMQPKPRLFQLSGAVWQANLRMAAERRNIPAAAGRGHMVSEDHCARL